MYEITVAATLENLDTVLDFINDQLENTGCNRKFITQLDLAAEEIFVNIANYAYAPESGDVTVRCDIFSQPRQVQITFSDSGHPYDPLKKEDPDISQTAKDRPIGGLGIFMVKKLSDQISYQFLNGQNILTFKKNIED